MLRGFLTGSLALIVLYVGVQAGSAGKAEQASNVLVAGLRRLLSPNVAGIGSHAKSATPASTSGSTTTVPASTTTGVYFQNL